MIDLSVQPKRPAVRCHRPIRSQTRWNVEREPSQVIAVDTEYNRIAARRLDDGARAAFSGEYLRENITYGYAITVHASQGATSDATHAVPAESTSRAMLYVAMTRGRESNVTYLYERTTGEGDHEHADAPGVHVIRRGSGRQAATLIRAIIANHDARTQPADDVAGSSDPEQLPARVKRLAV
jgi:hypothetical protein